MRTRKGDVSFHKDAEGAALIELATAYTPDNAIREFTTNALDARLGETVEDIAIVVNPAERRVIISDNGEGMTPKKLSELPLSVGRSVKMGDLDSRGEKGLGLLSFGSLGEAMHIVSRDFESASQDFGYLMWEINEQKGKIPFEFGTIRPREVDENFYGIFPQGTRVVIDRVDPHIMKELLTVAKLKSILGPLYTPALRREDVNMTVARLNPRARGSMKLERVEPVDFTAGELSELVMDTVLSVSIKGQEEDGELEVLLYVNPDADTDKFAVHTKDVQVYRSLAELPEFQRSPVWTSGKVSGYVNDRFNRLVLGRDGIQRKSNAFRSWLGQLQEVEEQIRPIVEAKKKSGRSRQDETRIKDAYEAVADAWKDLAKHESSTQYTRSREGDIKDVVGAEPTKKRPPKGTPRRPRTPRPERGIGPGTFTESEDGHPERVVPKRGVPFAFPQPRDFSAGESHLRIKVEYLLGAQPTIYINSAHPDYQDRAHLRDSTPLVRYVVELLSDQHAYHDMREAHAKKRMVGEPPELLQTAISRSEDIKFRALRRLGIK